MRITLAPTPLVSEDKEPPDREPPQYLTTYLVNDSIAIDAGSVGLAGTPAEQARIRHIFITHTHIDHIASLPIFLENVYDLQGQPVTIYGSQVVLDTLQRDMFNGRIWPDFIAFSRQGYPILQLEVLTPGQAVHLDGLKITPVPVNHVVPTCGFIVEDESSAIVISSDTGPTGDIWERANRLTNLKAVFLEASFPNAQARLANLAMHLTPADFAHEARKIKNLPRLIAVHIKARFRDQIVAELHALQLPNLEIGKAGTPYDF